MKMSQIMNLFKNTETAFKLKSNRELNRAYFLFKMIGSPLLVRVGTALTNFALKAHLPVKGMIRATVFDHFCGGITEEDCLQGVKKMYNEGGVSSVLDYSVEGKEKEESFDEATEKILKIIRFSEEKKSIPFAVFKPTGFGRFALYQKISEKKELTTDEQAEWKRVKERFHKVCKLAHDKNVPILIDAEESWIQDAIDDLVEELMEVYNKEKPIVFNTLQMYRHDRMNYLKELHQRGYQKGFYIGFKVVRGAYMEKERERAKAMGYPSPICEDKKATDINYDNAIRYIMEYRKMALFAGTHNEQSNYLLMDLVKEHKFDKHNPNLWFAQLYGMSDHISFNLAKEGYNVAKYVPFGPVKDVMPYLIRRAKENTSVEGQTSRELELIQTEKRRRKL